MNDCVNGDIRDVLPELVNGILPAGDVARVQEHVRACADCAAEVELLRTARAAMRLAPTMDTMRIASAVHASTAQRLAARRSIPRFTGLASIAAIVLLGAVGLWVTRDSAVVDPGPRMAESGAVAEAIPSVVAHAPEVVQSAPARAPAQLALGGDMSQLGEEQLLALLEEVSGLEAMPDEEPTPLAIEPVFPVDEEESR